jgi:hypothetical protein
MKRNQFFNSLSIVSRLKAKIGYHLLFFSIILFSDYSVLATPDFHLIPGGFSPVSGKIPSLSINWTYSTTDSYANSYIVPAANSWNNISFQVSLNKVTSGSYVINAVTSTSTTTGSFGEMIPYCSDGSGYKCNFNKNWNSARVIGYVNQMTSYNFTSTQIISNYAHEFGHALSLDHYLGDPNVLPAVLMKQGKQGILPQQTDKGHLIEKWGS